MTHRIVTAERGTGTDKSYRKEEKRNQGTDHGVFCPGDESGPEKSPHLIKAGWACSGQGTSMLGPHGVKTNLKLSELWTRRCPEWRRVVLTHARLPDQALSPQSAPQTAHQKMNWSPEMDSYSPSDGRASARGSDFYTLRGLRTRGYLPGSATFLLTRAREGLSLIKALSLRRAFQEDED